MWVQMYAGEWTQREGLVKVFLEILSGYDSVLCNRVCPENLISQAQMLIPGVLLVISHRSLGILCIL